jgi:hypothetical protein
MYGWEGFNCYRDICADCMHRRAIARMGMTEEMDGWNSNKGKAAEKGEAIMIQVRASSHPWRERQR